MTHVFGAKTRVSAGSTSTQVINCRSARLYGVKWPSAMTSTTATVYGGYSESDLQPLTNNAGAPLQVAVSAGQTSVVYWHAVETPYVQLVLNASEAQDRDIVVLLQEDI